MTEDMPIHSSKHQQETMEVIDRTQTTDTIDAVAVGGEHLGIGYYRSFKFLGAIAGLSLSLCCVYASYLMPVGILATINADIGPDANYAQIPIVWTIVVAVGYTLIGRVSDIFGRRYFVIGGNVLGLIGAIMSATAKNINTLIGASVFIGFQGAVGLSYFMLVGELVPIKDRGFWYFAILIPCTPFALFGAYISHAFVLVATWRWIYYLNIILEGLTLILLGLCYFPPSFHRLHQRSTRKQQIRDMDYLGIVLFIAGLVLLLLGISWGGGKYPWKSGAVIAPIVIGFLLLVAFGFWEAHGTATKPLVPREIVSTNKRYFLMPMISGTVGGMFYYGLSIIWPLEVSQLYPSGLKTEGWLSSVLTCGAQVGAMLGDLTFTPLGHQRLQFTGAFVFMIAFTVGLTFSTANTRAMSIACAFLSGIGTGLVEVIAVMIAQVGSDANNIGLIVGLLGSARSVGGSVSQAIYVTVLQNKLGTSLPDYVSAAAVKAGLPQSSLPQLFAAMATGSAQAYKSVPGITPGIITAAMAAQQNAYAYSLKYVYYAALAFGGLGFIFACCIVPNVDKEMTGFVAKKIQGVHTANEVGDVEMVKAVETHEHS